MKHGSLFSGIGGFDLAAEWMGWENVFHCEWNEFGQKILKHYWPNAISYTDITKTDFTIHRGTIDILTGGFPCQPYSAAGKRLGTEDDRHLWPEMLRAVREIQPVYVVGENVRGLTNWNGGLVFDQVQADLEAEGYEVLPFLLPACAVGAPHRRDRIWFIAYSESFRINRAQELENNSRQGGEWRGCDINNVSEISNKNRNTITPDSQNVRRESSGSTWNRRSGFEDSDSWITPNPDSGKRFEGWMHQARPIQAERHTGTFNTRYGRGDWTNFPTQSPVCSRNDGLSTQLDGITFPKWRNESIKGYGNAIVPQIAYQIFKAIELA